MEQGVNMADDLWTQLRDELRTMEIPADAPPFAREKIAFALGMQIESRTIGGGVPAKLKTEG